MKVAIEEQRTRLGYGVHQVFINTDLAAGTSGTYRKGVRLLQYVHALYTYIYEVCVYCMQYFVRQKTRNIWLLARYRLVIIPSPSKAPHVEDLPSREGGIFTRARSEDSRYFS